MKHANNQDVVMLWVKRDDEGNITDWEMTIKRDDLIKILSEVIDELKESGKQIPAEKYEKLLQHLLEEKTTHNDKPKKK